MWSVSIHRTCKHAGRLYVHPGPDGRYGDEVAWCCYLEFHGASVKLCGAMFAPPTGAKPIILTALAGAGFTAIEWERRNRVEPRIVRFALGGSGDGRADTESAPPVL